MKELLEVCREVCAVLERRPLAGPAVKRLKNDSELRRLADRIRPLLHTVGEVFTPKAPAPSDDNGELKMAAWNIERGKGFESILHAFKTNLDLKEADIHFLTEVDWGMARSGNRNVTADLGEALNRYAYFAPSYFNFTPGHGSERHITEANIVGLHGKAILSRYPLKNLRVVALPNAIDKLRSKEARLGQKRALIGTLRWKNEDLDVACVHLDAFSSPRQRARQMMPIVEACKNSARLVLAGDWNTNTLNSTSGSTVLLSVLRQLLFTGPSKMVTSHHPRPERKFDRPLFRILSETGLDFEHFNETGVGTFDLLTNDQEMGQMASDQFPVWILKWINRLVEKSGGLISLKLDWFAGRGLRPVSKKVLRLKPGIDFPPDQKPSDHHPILLRADFR